VAITLALVAGERLLHLGVFDPAYGGDPILFQHLFWFYSHPAVYIMVLPAMGVISEIVASFTRKEIYGYKFVAAASLAIAVFGFLVWGHHMFVSGQSIYAGMIFSLLSYAVAIPSAVKVFNWTATLYKSSVSLHTPILYAFGFIGLFTIGGFTGFFLAALWVDNLLIAHLLRHRALPLHYGRGRGDGLSGRHPLLVAKDFGPDVPGNLGQAGGADRLHRIQPDLLSAIHTGLPGDAAPLSRLPR